MTTEHQTEPVQRRPRLLGVRLLVVCALVWLVVALPSLTDAGAAYPLSLFLGGAWALLAWAWVRLPLLSLGRLRSRPWRRWWLTAGAIVTSGAVLAMTDLGTIARLYLCERQVTAYVTSVAPKTAEFQHEPRGVGLFRVVGTGESHGTVTVETTTGFLDRHFHGLVYAPKAEGELPMGKIQSRHLYGPWYAFRGFRSL
jgi:hypothetical protein